MEESSSLQPARQFDPGRFVSSNDDGIPFYQGSSPLLSGHRSEDGGYFFLRFSNNPEEPAEQDQDHVLLVRSAGVIPSHIRSPFAPNLRNDVTLVEARLRQEVSFIPPSPLTVLGNSGQFTWAGTSFSIRSADQPAVSIVAFQSPQLYGDFVDSLSPAQAARLQGSSAASSVQDAAEYRSHPAYQVLFRLQFWRHFLDHLPAYTDDRIVFLPQGGEWNQDLSGLLVALGETRLTGRARVKGLVLHLGGGELILEEQAEITGAVWMSHLEASDGGLSSKPLALRVSDSARIRHDSVAVREAVAHFPPTLRGWRLLFPEMRL